MGIAGDPTTKPLLRWAGSKRKLLPVLSSYWDKSFKRYIEPFAGSACLYFALLPPDAVLTDINADLINAYQNIRLLPREVWQLITSLSPDKETYYSIRNLQHTELSPLERAVNFLYLNKLCFNGLYRTNSKGFFNVPYSGYKTGGFPSWESFLASAKALEAATIYQCDFATALENSVQGDFVYIDPPYAQKNVKIFSQYGPDSFGLNDLSRLAQLLDGMDRRGVKFIVSYAKSEEAVYFFDKWKSKTVTAQRNIAGFAKHRKIAEEVIFSNF
jgi:DNA adenine methylase